MFAKFLRNSYRGFYFSKVVFLQPSTLLKNDLVQGISLELCLFSRNSYSEGLP